MLDSQAKAEYGAVLFLLSFPLYTTTFPLLFSVRFVYGMLINEMIYRFKPKTIHWEVVAVSIWRYLSLDRSTTDWPPVSAL